MKKILAFFLVVVVLLGSTQNSILFSALSFTYTYVRFFQQMEKHRLLRLWLPGLPAELLDYYDISITATAYSKDDVIIPIFKFPTNRNSYFIF